MTIESKYGIVGDEPLVADDAVADDGTKSCPECAEQVQGAARVCRFCGHRFDGQQVAGVQPNWKWALIAAMGLVLLSLWLFHPALEGWHMGCNMLGGDNQRLTNVGIEWCKRADTE